MINKLYYNGKDITSDINNFDSFSIDYGTNANNTVNRSLSQSITVSGDTFKNLEKIYFDSCAKYDQIQEVIFKSDICDGIIIKLKLTFEGMIYTPDKGEITLLLKSVSLEDAIYSKLDSTYWFENKFAENNKIPVMYYADQPNAMTLIIIVLTMIIRVVTLLVDKINNFLCKIRSIGGLLYKCEKDILTHALFSKLDTWIAGLGKWSVAPLLRDVLNYQCTIAGASFSSSIFDPNSEYYNLTMFIMDTGVHGKEINKNEVIRVLNENAPLWTVKKILDNLKMTFEGYDYRIIDNVVYFEKKEFFYKMANKELFNLRDKDVCASYEYKRDNMWAWGSFDWTKGAYDQEGSKVSRYYQLKLEWNKPYSPTRKGTLQRIVPFAASRFMYDMFSYSNNKLSDWESKIDDFRRGAFYIKELGIVIENQGIHRERDIVITGNTLSVPKLLVLENDFNYNDAKVIRKEFKKRDYQYWLYNYPLLYKENVNSKENDYNGKRGMLASFAQSADPRIRKDKMEIKSINIDCDCDSVNLINSNFQSVYFQTIKGKAIPRNAKIDFKDNKAAITLSDNSILC